MPGLPAPAVSFCRCSSSHCCFLSNNDSTVVADKQFRLADKIAPVIENSPAPYCQKKQVCSAVDVLDVIALGKQTLQLPRIPQVPWLRQLEDSGIDFLHLMIQ